MFIGEVEKATGATPRAIRLYETLGLIEVPRSGKYRVFNDEHIEFIQLIKEAQTLGVTLAELQESRREDGTLDWGNIHRLLEQKQQDVAQEIERLSAHRSRIKRYQEIIADCI